MIVTGSSGGGGLHERAPKKKPEAPASVVEEVNKR